MTTSREVLSFPDVLAMSGASYRQLHYWVGQGWVVSARDRGRREWAHTFTPYEATVATIINRLIQAGFSPSRATARVARDIGDAGWGAPVALPGGVWLTLTDPNEED